MTKRRVITAREQQEMLSPWRTAMTKRKPVYFALNPEYPGHAMAYWGDRYDPIAEVKWQTKGLPGYGAKFRIEKH